MNQYILIALLILAILFMIYFDDMTFLIAIATIIAMFAVEVGEQKIGCAEPRIDHTESRIDHFTYPSALSDVAHRMHKYSENISDIDFQNALDSISIFANTKFNRCWSAEYIPYWHRDLRPEIKFNKKSLKYLQIGVFEGMSLLYLTQVVLAGYDLDITVIDNFSTEPYFNTEDTFDHNTRDLKVTKIKHESYEALQTLIANGSKFDFIYCSGSRKPDVCFVDFALLSKVIDTNGMILFDTYEVFAKYDSDVSPDIVRDTFCASFKKQIDVIAIDRQKLVKFKPLPVDNWTPVIKKADCINRSLAKES